MEPGYAKTNQDLTIVLPQLADEAHALFGVLDGHGAYGHLVAAAAVKSLAASFLPMDITGDDLAGKIWDAFLTANEHLQKRSGIDCSFSGATATISVLHGRQLTTGWVGDSRAVLGRRENGQVCAYDLTNDHKPTLENERQRILAAGGRVEPLTVR